MEKHTIIRLKQERNYLENSVYPYLVKYVKFILAITIGSKLQFNAKRSLYYWAKMYSQQITEGQEYDELKKCIA